MVCWYVVGVVCWYVVGVDCWHCCPLVLFAGIAAFDVFFALLFVSVD